MSAPSRRSRGRIKGHLFLKEQLQPTHMAVLRWQDAVNVGMGLLEATGYNVKRSLQ